MGGLLYFEFSSRTEDAMVRSSLVLLLAAGLATAGAAETVEMTTYYPAPVGVYQRLTTTDQAVLARDGGNVGVGVLAPAHKLDVAGDASVHALLLQPQAAPPASPGPGTMYYAADGHLYLYSEGAWQQVLVFSGKTVGTAALGADYTFTTSNHRILTVKFRTAKSGLYDFKWSGIATIAAVAGMYSNVVVRRCGSTLIQRMTIDDEDDSNATVEPNNIDGSTMLQLNANVNYCYDIEGYKKGNTAAKNTTILTAGAGITVQELFAF
jgi:hypothetical protein